MTLTGSGRDLGPISTLLAIVCRQAASVADFVDDYLKYRVHKQRCADAKVDRFRQEYHLPVHIISQNGINYQ